MQRGGSVTASAPLHFGAWAGGNLYDEIQIVAHDGGGGLLVVGLVA